MTGTPVPTILTRRLKLRGHEASDFDTLKAIWSDPDIVRFIGGVARPATQVWTNLLRNRGLWDVLGYGYWLAEDRKTGQFVGEVGFADFKRETEPSISGAPECGWIIAPSAHGKGYASEAVTAIHDWLDDALSGQKSVCIIAHENAPSIRIAEKVGYQPCGEVMFNGELTRYFERQP